MKSYQRKRLTGLFIFALLVCIYILVLWLLKLPDSIQYQALDTPETITESDIHSFVEITFDKLYYTGTDYLQDGVSIGSYYYYELKETDALLSSRYLLVLAKTTTGQTELTDYTCRCRIMDNSGMPNVLSTLSANSHIHYSDIEQMFLPLMLSEVDYPHTAIIVTYTLMVITAIGILFFLVSVFHENKDK